VQHDGTGTDGAHVDSSTAGIYLCLAWKHDMCRDLVLTTYAS
jgi:hypothetical protein